MPIPNKGQDPIQPGQEPGGDVTQPDGAKAAPTTPPPSGSGDPESDLVKALRQEAAGRRVHERELEVELAKSKKTQADREAADAAKRGEFEGLYKAEQAKSEGLRAGLVRERARGALVRAGIDPELAEHIHVDLAGVTIGDDGQIQGPLDERVKAIAEKFRAKAGVKTAPAPAGNGQPTATAAPTVIGPKPAEQLPESKAPKGIAGTDQRFMERLKRQGITSPDQLYGPQPPERG